MVSIPLTCSVWCMYHCQYSCPCYKYKNPLDFAPDVESGARNVAKRSLGNKFTTGVTRPVRKRRKSGEKGKAEAKKTVSEHPKKTKVNDDLEEDTLLGIEDIDPDWPSEPVKPECSQVQHPATAATPKRRTNSAR